MDLLLLEHALGGLPAGAWEKARNAYGPSVESAWPRALERLRARPDPRHRAYEAMGVTASAREVIEARLRALPPVEEP